MNRRSMTKLPINRVRQRKLWYPVVASDDDMPLVPVWLQREVIATGREKWIAQWGRAYGLVPLANTTDDTSETTETENVVIDA